MRILVLTLMMSFLSHSAFGAEDEVDGGDGNRHDPNLLFYAAINERAEDIIRLIEYLKIDIHHTNQDGETALIWTAANGHTDTVEALSIRKTNTFSKRIKVMPYS